MIAHAVYRIRHAMRERERLRTLKYSNIALFDEMDEARSKRKKKGLNKRRSASSWYEKRLSQAGINIPSRLYVAVCLFFSVSSAIVALVLGVVFSLFILVALSYYLLWWYLDDRATKRQKRVIPQLAPFIDGLASALSTGFNIEGAVIQAVEGVPPGILRLELDRVVKALNTGFTVKESMGILKERIAGKEVTSLVVALNLFSSMGGTVLEPFRRLAKKIREQQAVAEKANRDLVMVKQAFLIIFLLAVLAPVVLMMMEPDYLMEAYRDTLGRLIFQIGAIMVVSAVLIFKKITNLKV